MQKIGGLEFVYTENQITKNIDYDSLIKFIKEEFLKSKLECDKQKEEVFILCDELEKLKLIQKEKEREYQMRQKQVTTYLECKKSFFGKIRYYFKGKKQIKQKEEESVFSDILQKREEEEESVVYDNKEYYTLEDLVDITKVLERTETQIKNTNQDIKALNALIERLTKKIDNAKNYIDEIEEHKKSIFEFWKFVGEDKALRTK